MKRVPCLLLLCVAGAAQSQGLGLGVVEGVPRLGRPLTLTVPVNGAPDSWTTGACVSGNVYYGDILLPQGSVRLALTSEPGASQGRLTLQTTQAVNEAFVTVELRLGCQATLTRRYVLLTEWPDAASPQPVQPMLTVPSPPDPAVAVQSSSASSSPTREQGMTSRAVAKPTAQTRPRAESPGRSLQASPRLAAQTAASTLRLESADEWATLLSPHGTDDAPLRLRLSTEWSPPVPGGMTREEAAHAWKALRSTPEERQSWLETVTASQAKLEALRDENKRLREASHIQDEALRQAQSRQSLWTVGLSLAGVFAVIWGFVVWHRRRRREAQTWHAWNKASRWINAWNEGGEESPAARPPVAVTSAAAHIAAKPGPTPGHAAALKVAKPASGPLPETGHATPSSGRTPVQPLVSPAQASVLDFGSSFSGPSRLFAVEDLSDLQQQAEFFMSLGEYEQAIAVLRQHLEDSVDPSPLTYLDLFMLYHKLGRIDDYERLRVAFAERFNARAPAFEHYGHAEEGLEGHPKTLARLSQLWPDAKVLDLIERLLFSRAGGEGLEVLDLEAYRDLLLLHAIAQDLAERPSRPSTGLDFQHTNIEPLHLLRTPAEGGPASASVLLGVPSLPQEVVPPASPRLALDIDLDEFDPWSGRSPRA